MPDTGTTAWPSTDDVNLPSDKTIPPTDEGDGNYTFVEWLQRVTGILRAVYTDLNVGKVAALPMGNHKITGLADGTVATDAATLGQVQALLNGLDWAHPSARAATTANITLNGAQTIDGVSVIAGDRVLVKDQSTGSQNGIYVAAAGAWSRATDADASAEVTAGLAVTVEEGTLAGDTVWILTTNAPITVGSTSLTFQQLPTPNALLAGAGLTRTGNQLDAVANADGSIVVNANDIQAGDGGVIAAKVAKSLYDANTILKADSDDTPAALSVGASTVVGRLAAGGIVAVTMAELKTLLAGLLADFDDPFGWGLPVSCWPRERAANVSITANQGRYMRSLGGGTISKIAIHVGTQSGNISVAAYQNSGSGVNAVPGTRLATSGAVACPAAGYAEVSLGGSVAVKHGDWLFLSADNGTAGFHAGNASIATSDLGKGFSYFQNTAHPAPSPAGAVTAMDGDSIILKGVA